MEFVYSYFVVAICVLNCFLNIQFISIYFVQFVGVKCLLTFPENIKTLKYTLYMCAYFLQSTNSLYQYNLLP